mmetsp:Transcript_594/g.1073  ORF Transcript_594/g.1073 Transcript_594/m.1073 type:complete len:114 (+) Transcript_594:2777-3118(+)
MILLLPPRSVDYHTLLQVPKINLCRANVEIMLWINQNHPKFQQNPSHNYNRNNHIVVFFHFFTRINKSRRLSSVIGMAVVRKGCISVSLLFQHIQLRSMDAAQTSNRISRDVK